MCRSKRNPHSKPPSKLLFLVEGRAIYEYASTLLSRRVIESKHRCDGHPVMTLPGFIASDLSTRPLRRFLGNIGLSPHRWRLGRNYGHRPEMEELLINRLVEVQRMYERKVSLVGWSLGGVYARLLANRAPELVRSVITMGSPFRGDPRANHSWRLFERVSGTAIEEIDPQTIELVRKSPPVPTTAIYSRFDGITNWRCCVDDEGPETENVEVKGSHIGLGYNPLVLNVIGDRLAQPEGEWQPFDRSGIRSLLYSAPQVGAAH